jgi:NAD(P)H-dependent FMN reductase
MTAPDTRLHLAIVIGSTRQGRIAPTVAAWFAREVTQRLDMVADVIDLADVALPAVLGAAHAPPAVDAGARLQRADAFVIVTPEYNHSFPGALKNALDSYYEPWRAKPVGFVSYGGASGGLRAVEQLRQVFAELHAVTVRDGVSFHGVWSQFDEWGEPTDGARSRKNAATMLNQLYWWGDALREARSKALYPS